MCTCSSRIKFAYQERAEYCILWHGKRKTRARIMRERERACTPKSPIAKFWWTGASDDFISNDSETIFPSFEQNKKNMWKLIHIRNGSIKFRSKILWFASCKKKNPAQQLKNGPFSCTYLFFVYATYGSILLWKFPWTCYICICVCTKMFWFFLWCRTIF